MKNVLLIIAFATLITSCGAKKPAILATTSNPTTSSLQYEPFLDVTENAPDDSYGLTEDNPVKVGEKSATNQRRFLASLAGPNGEVISFHRRGSCCPYPSENGYNGSAMLDIYEVTYEGLKNPIYVYISFYDLEKLYIPKGFTKRGLE